MPRPYDDFDRQFEMFLNSIQKIIQLCSSIKQYKKKKSKTPWFINKVQNTISRKRQALKRFREKPTASNETRLLRNSRKTNYTVEEPKCNLSSNVVFKYHA